MTTDMPNMMRLVNNGAQINVEMCDCGTKVELWVWPGGEEYASDLTLTLAEADELVRRFQAVLTTP